VLGYYAFRTPPKLRATLSKLPVYFIENQGQLDRQVSYYVQGQGLGVYFAPGGVTFAFSEKHPAPHEARLIPAAWTEESKSRRWSMKLDFLGANPVRPVGLDRTSAVISYFKGKPSDWKTGVAAYSGVVYRDLWPGIDLAYSGQGERLKYEFVVQPGADPEHIRLAYRGAEQVRVNDAGELEVTTPVGGFRDQKPYVYQERNGRRVEVAASYQMHGDAAYGFHVGAYDRTLPVVLDPTLLYAGYIGGANQDQANGIAADSAGNAYVTGYTNSSDFPLNVGPDLTLSNQDAFVVKVNAAGTALLYAGYIGGEASEIGNGIAVDGAGNAYVTGQTNSFAFPVVGGAGLPPSFGTTDAFVAKVNAAGTALLYSGYLGGAGFDAGNGMAVDGAGNAYVTGLTTSAGFPVTVGPAFGGGTFDAFVVKLNPAGTLVYSRFLGGSNNDYGFGIAADSGGNAYVTGHTGSPNFPVTVGPDLTFHGPPGHNDAFVTKVNPTGTALIYSGYIGASGADGFLGGEEQAYGIAVDAAGNAYITGVTDSVDFPVKVGPLLTTAYPGIHGDAFVAKVNAAGTGLVYAGYLGGVVGGGNAIAVDLAGNAYITGHAGVGSALPVSGGPGLTYQGGFDDAFVAEVNAAGTGLVYAGYIGGTGDDEGRGIAVDAVGNAYVAGVTSSNQASFPVTVGPDVTFNGGTDAFVAKIGAGGGPSGDITYIGTNLVSIACPAGVFTVTGNITIINNLLATNIDCHLVTSVSGSVNINGDTAATVIDAGSLHDVGGSFNINGDTAATTIDAASLHDVGGSFNINGDTAATTIDAGSLQNVGGSFNINGDTAATTIDAGSLHDVSGSVSINGDTAATTIDAGSLQTVGGNVNITNNGTCTNVTTGSLTSVTGDLNVQSCGSGTFTLGTASAGGNTTLASSGYTNVCGTTAKGTTLVTNNTGEAVVSAQLLSGAFSSPSSFCFTHLDGAALPPTNGTFAGSSATVDPVTAYQITFGVPTLNQPATLTFLVTLSALDPATQTAFLAALNAGLVTLATTPSAGGSYQAFPICAAGATPTIDGCVLVERLDANGQPTTGTPAKVRFSNVVGHFSIWGVAIVKPVTATAPQGAGYWKNHDAATQSRLPQRLGNYTVDTLAKAAAVFDNMNCSNSQPNNAAGCLAGQLLAAKLNVANGASACISATIASADSFLIGINYVGPAGSYPLSEAQRQSAITLKTALENYNAGLGCP
jgi:hypothetical protein